MTFWNDTPPWQDEVSRAGFCTRGWFLPDEVT